MPLHGIATNVPSPPLLGRKVENQLRVDVGGTQWIRVEEEEDWGGGVNRDPVLARLVSVAQTRSGSRRSFGDATADGI
jgi:hypothetical protein